MGYMTSVCMPAIVSAMVNWLMYLLCKNLKTFFENATNKSLQSV